ncbi:unnamed protein product [Mytilus coruscus]|uniref:B box-type domain-containing protein n=1 Tax=Mytilus coruscus TaxID=42192 RepID=A0A6J8CSS2_MYTCO|nr:unnamed protein product [Mytilus coruscus]
MWRGCTHWISEVPVRGPSNMMKSHVEMCVNCENKDKKKAVSWCTYIECRYFVCKTCKTKFHEKMGHEVLPIKTIQQLSPSLAELSKYCEEHTDKTITLVCRDHDKMICDVCQSDLHQDCKLISPEKAASCFKGGTAMCSLERRMEDQTQVSKKILSKTVEELRTLNETKIELKQRVSQIKQKSVDRLNKLEEDMHTEIDNMYEQCNETLSKNKDSLISSASLLLKWKTDLESLKQNTSEFHLYQSVKFLEKRTNEEESEIRKNKIATVPTIRYRRSELESNMENLLADLGTVTLENVLVQNPELHCDQEGDDVGIGGGCFISGDRLLIGHYGDTKLSICNLDGSNCRTLNLDYKPGCIIPYDNDHALVSAGHEDCDSDKVFVVTSDGIERELYSSSDLKGIGGVAVDDSGDVFIAGYSSNNIHKLYNNKQKRGIIMTVDDVINRPTGLSFNTETKELLVVNDFHQSINIYKQQ